jgi:hypothetical protein
MHRPAFFYITRSQSLLPDVSTKNEPVQTFSLPHILFPNSFHSEPVAYSTNTFKSSRLLVISNLPSFKLSFPRLDSPANVNTLSNQSSPIPKYYTFLDIINRDSYNALQSLLPPTSHLSPRPSDKHQDVYIDRISPYTAFCLFSRELALV